MDNWGWSEEQLNTLVRMARQKKYFYTEIAEKLGKNPQSVRHKARTLGLPRTQKTLAHRFGKWNAKHAHLRESVLKYFLTHTWEETRKKFSLTKGELKSCMSVGYRDPKYKHLRKATNDHSPWSIEHLTFLLRHAGLRHREWIAEKIGRGNKTCIKERMQFLGVASRNMQGLTLSQYQEAFGEEPMFFLQTDAGPWASSGHHRRASTKWKIIPWVYLNSLIKDGFLKVPEEFEILVSARAMFQEWIFEGNALLKMKKICKGIKS